MMRPLLLLLLALPLLGAEKICGVFEWEQNRNESAEILKNLQAIGEKAEIVRNYDFKKYDVLIVPKAVSTPLPLRDAVPAFLSGGGHLILDGWPLKTFDGKREAPEWGELLPGTTHCVMDSAAVFKGMRNPQGGNVTLSCDGKGPGKLRQLACSGVRNVSWRSMNKCQWRLTGPLSPGRMEFHDCMDATPLAIRDASGKVIGQHTAQVKHFCSFFPGANVVCADIQPDPALKLLYGPHGKDYLRFLLDTVRLPLANEPAPEYWRNLHELRRQITGLKLYYTESVYLFKELHFHNENNRRLGMTAVPDLSTEFGQLESDTLDLCRQFAKYRFNRFPFAVKRKEELLKKVEKQIGMTKSFLAKGRSLEQKLLAAHGEKRFTIPERGSIDIKMSYGDYEPLSWGGAPGFAEYENGRAIASLGIDGSCGPNYVSRSAYRIPTDQNRKEDEYSKQVFERYVRETGLHKFTSHEIPTQMIPRSLAKEAAARDIPYVADQAKGTLRQAVTAADFNARLGGVGIISSATESPAFWNLIEFMAKRAAKLDGVHTRSITFEGMLMGGYSEYGFRKYREFLKERHKTIEALNKAWNSSWKSFGEIRPPVQYQRTPAEHANNFDWIEFRTREFNRFIEKVASIYRKYDPVHPLTACINQASPLDGVEFYEFNRFIDFAASHNTPTSRAWYQIGLGRRGQRADNSEPKWISFSAPWNLSNSEDELQKCQRFNMIYYAAQGMSQFAPYEWRHGTSARFGEYDGMLYLAGAEFKEFTRWKKKWQNLMGAVAPKDHAKTGVYWSFVTKSHGRGGIFETKIDQSLFCRYFGLLDAWNRLLDKEQIPYETVTRGKVKNNEIAHLETLIVPQASFLEPEVMEKLLNFAENGGELILEGQAGRYDQYKKEDNRIFDGLGMVQVAAASGRLSGGAESQALLTQEEVGPAYLTFEMLEPEKTKIICRYTDSKPAAVSMNYGKGKVICTGFSLTGVTEEKVVKKILEKSLHNREAHSDDAGVRIFPWKGQNGFLYLAVLNRSGNWRSASVTLAGAVQEAYDIETGVRLNHKESEINVPLFPAGGRMIAVRIGKGEKSK